MEDMKTFLLPELKNLLASAASKPAPLLVPTRAFDISSPSKDAETGSGDSRRKLRKVGTD